MSAPTASPASFLISQAERLETEGRLSASRAVYAAAAELDLRCRTSYAEFLARIGRLEEARREWSAARGDFQRAGDSVGEMLACRQLAALSRELGDFSAADCWQQRAFSVLFDSGRGSVLTAADMIARASDWMAKEDYSNAERLLARVIESARAVDDRESEADAWGTLGLVHGRRGELKSAARCLRRASSLHARCGDDQGASADALNFAEVLRLEGRWNAARVCLRRAIRSALAARDSHRWMTATRRLKELERLRAIQTFDPRRN